MVRFGARSALGAAMVDSLLDAALHWPAGSCCARRAGNAVASAGGLEACKLVEVSQSTDTKNPKNGGVAEKEK